ncbi:MAG: pyridoxal 5'-phosphate synthase glutaminase subunit PdxT [Candidatus Magasanikbacteria bacterium]|nr:pyridoxal 5'-phosphate synthase glutaminase subunit PdxT [Candidatus Magasanikbacteria bacterium]
MSGIKKIGVLAFQGDAIEHIEATIKALQKLKLKSEVVSVRSLQDLKAVVGLIIPGGESTVLYTLCERAGMIDGIKKIPYIFGTCAGAILLAKRVEHSAPGKKTLGLMDITVDRNAYGSQTESFEKDIDTNLGKLHAIFIRAPRIIKMSKQVTATALDKKEILACEEQNKHHYYLAACFHPELTTTIFHEYFLKKVFSASLRAPLKRGVAIP